MGTQEDAIIIVQYIGGIAYSPVEITNISSNR